jgi:hypothetical protein
MIRRDHLPCYLHCLDGANVTGLVVMCLRKLQNYALSYAFAEFFRFVRGAGEVVAAEKEFVRNFGATAASANSAAVNAAAATASASGAGGAAVGGGGGAGAGGGGGAAECVVRLPCNPFTAPPGAVIDTSAAALSAASAALTLSASSSSSGSSTTGASANNSPSTAIVAAPLPKWLWGGKRALRHPTVRIFDPSASASALNPPGASASTAAAAAAAASTAGAGGGGGGGAGGVDSKLLMRVAMARTGSGGDGSLEDVNGAVGESGAEAVGVVGDGVDHKLSEKFTATDAGGFCALPVPEVACTDSLMRFVAFVVADGLPAIDRSRATYYDSLAVQRFLLSACSFFTHPSVVCRPLCRHSKSIPQACMWRRLRM